MFMCVYYLTEHASIVHRIVTIYLYVCRKIFLEEHCSYLVVNGGLCLLLRV